MQFSFQRVGGEKYLGGRPMLMTLKSSLHETEIYEKRPHT